MAKCKSGNENIIMSGVICARRIPARVKGDSVTRNVVRAEDGGTGDKI